MILFDAESVTNFYAYTYYFFGISLKKRPTAVLSDAFLVVEKFIFG